MAGSVNKVILIGNLGKDPEVRYTPQGKVVANFSLATTETWGTGEERREQTEWHNVVVWGRQAEHVGQYLAKGRRVYVEGRLQTRKWQDPRRQQPLYHGNCGGERGFPGLPRARTRPTAGRLRPNRRRLRHAAGCRIRPARSSPGSAWRRCLPAPFRQRSTSPRRWRVRRSPADGRRRHSVLVLLDLPLSPRPRGGFCLPRGREPLARQVILWREQDPSARPAF